MSCRHTDKQLQEYVDGRGSARWRASVEQHLAECAECARALGEYRGLKRLLNVQPGAEPGPDFEAAVFARCQEQRSRGAVGAGWSWLRFRLAWRLVPGLATAAAAVIVGLAFWTLPGGPGGSGHAHAVSIGFLEQCVEQHRLFAEMPEEFQLLANGAELDFVKASIDASTGLYLMD